MTTAPQLQMRRSRTPDHDRLYVSLGDEQIGWIDLHTDELHAEVEGAEPTLLGTVETWRRHHPEAPPATRLAGPMPPASPDTFRWR